MGGGPLEPLCRYLLELTGKPDPRVCFLTQATGENPDVLLRSYEVFPGERCRRSHLRLFGIPRRDWRDHLLAQDAIFVGGGSTANMLGIWRAHGVEAVLREAWTNGIVLGGVSAGAICWFQAGVTDSFRAELDGIDCLGFLPGSACPHYDGEDARRPAYHRLVGDGFPPGIAIDDGVAAHFTGAELTAVVTSRPGATAYRVELDAGTVRETPLEALALA
jgi:dipeptidase E